MNTSTPHRRRPPRVLTGALVATLLWTCGAGPATASAPSPSALTSSAQTGFEGTTFDHATDETVDLAGKLHVRTRLSGSDAEGWIIEWGANADRATGTGEATGDPYSLHGFDGGSIAFPPGPPVRTTFFEPTLTLMPYGGRAHPPSPIRLLVAVSFDTGGQINGVQVHVGDTAPGSTTD